MPYWRLSNFYFFYFALLGAWLPFWPLFLQGEGFNAEQIGYLAGIMMATKIVAPSIWGWLSDVSQRRMMIIRWGAFLALLSFMVIFLERGFWWLALITAAFSFFWNAILAQFEVTTLAYLGGRYRRYSLIRLWGSIGFIVAVSGLGLFFDFYSVSYLPLVMVLLLIGIWVSSLLVAEKGKAEHDQNTGQTLKAVLKQPAVITFFIVCFLMQVSHGPYYTFFTVYLEDHGYSRTVSGLMWSLGVIAEVVLFLFMHRLLQRWSLRVIMLASLTLSALRWFMLAFWVENTSLLLIAQCLHAASFGSFHAYAVEVVRRAFAGGLAGQGMALYSSLSFGAGGAVGAVLSGWIWEFNPAYTFLMAAVACLLAIAIELKSTLEK